MCDSRGIKRCNRKNFVLTSVQSCDINIHRKMLRKVLGVITIILEVYAPQEV